MKVQKLKSKMYSIVLHYGIGIITVVTLVGLYSILYTAKLQIQQNVDIIRIDNGRYNVYMPTCMPLKDSLLQVKLENGKIETFKILSCKVSDENTTVVTCAPHNVAFRNSRIHGTVNVEEIRLSQILFQKWKRLNSNGLYTE